jgi:hypothetical protein
MTAHQHSSTFETSVFCEQVTRLAAPVQQEAESITPSGLNIYFPSKRCENYLSLLQKEALLKNNLFNGGRNIASVWFRGYPLRQLEADELTEMVFRLCNHFTPKHQRLIEKGLTLSPEHCSKVNLALFKGLGFDIIRILSDASLASDDHSVSNLLKAVESAIEYGYNRIHCEIQVSQESSSRYIVKVLAALTQLGVEEIELSTHPSAQRNSDPPTFAKEIISVLKTRNDGAYTLLGDNCLKKENHPHLKLLKNKSLNYAPWGYHDRRLINWLALGVGATGIQDGYLYSNCSLIKQYEERLEKGLSPIVGWSQTPVCESNRYKLIQSMYCHHKIDQASAKHQPLIVSNLLKNKWLYQKGEEFIISQEGLSHLNSIGKALGDNLPDDLTQS